MDTPGSNSSNPVVSAWKKFQAAHPAVAEFLVFFMVCNCVTVLQMIMMPVFKWVFGMTPL